MKSTNRPQVTIFTPTFNRATTLRRCYDSILEQKGVSLEWIIVDDGSLDDTKDVVERYFISEAKIKVRYYWRENSGKQSCWNFALDKAEGDYFIGLDSDDALLPGSLQIALKLCAEYNINSNEEIIGVRAPSVDHNFNVIGDGFRNNKNVILSWFNELSSSYHGERIDLLKVKVAKNYKYPIDKDTKFIPEAWFYSQVSINFKFLYINRPLRVFFDLEDNNRLSKSSLIENAKGQFISRVSLINSVPLTTWLKRPDQYVKTLIRLCQLSVHVKSNELNQIDLPYRYLVYIGKQIIKVTK